MTDRAKIANVRSILDSTAAKSDRRSRKVAGLGAARPEGVANPNSLVPVVERARQNNVSKLSLIHI